MKQNLQPVKIITSLLLGFLNKLGLILIVLGIFLTVLNIIYKNNNPDTLLIITGFCVILTKYMIKLFYFMFFEKK